MFKKIMLVTGFLVFAGVMVIGAIYRSEARINLVASSTTEDHAENINPTTSLTWQTLQGVVTQIDAAAIIISVQNNERVIVEGQPLAFAVGQGFAAALGDTITVEGYEENGELKIGRMTNLTSGQHIQLRDINGNPAWRGQGQGN
ncbi:MAG: hypothetical protein ABI690_35305 [Chloroflexota bacterium]